MGRQILALVSDAFGGHGGIARYNSDLLCALSHSAAVSRIVALPRMQPEPIGTLPAKVSQLPAIADQIRYSLKAVRLARQMPPGTLLFCGHLLMAPLAGFISRLTGQPLWLQVHGIDAWAKPTDRVRWGARRSDLVTAVSRYTRNQMLANWWDGSTDRIRVLPNTVDTAYSPGPKSPKIIARHGLAGRKVILTVSRLASAERYKGHDYVISALSQLRLDHPDAVYLIVGGGDGVDYLRSVAQTFDVAGHVIFAGKVPHEELPDYFRTADVFVMPSVKEGFGIVFLEAAACGIPVIGGNRDGSVDALADGEIGTLVDPEDPAMIAKAIDRAFKSSPRDGLKAVARFSKQNFEQHVGSIIEDLASGQVETSHGGRRRLEGRVR